MSCKPASDFGSDLVVERLGREQVRAVYPLIRQAAPSLTLSHWLAYARPGATQFGILVARRTGMQHPCGAACYRRDRDLRYGTVLTTEHIVALDLLYPKAVLLALLSELDSVAARLGCQAVRWIVHEGLEDLAHELRTAGQLDCRVIFTKALSGPGKARARMRR